MIYNKSGDKDDFVCSYDKVDNSGNKIEDSTSTLNIGIDTTNHVTKNFYDKQRKIISSSDYKNGKIVKEVNYSRGKNGAYTITTQVYGDAGEEEGDEYSDEYKVTNSTCADEYVSIAKYDKDSNELSEVTTGEQSGKTYTDRANHYLTYNKNGKLVEDSSVVTHEQYLAFASTTTIIKTKYDAKGNRTKYSYIGGAYPNESVLWKYNKENKVLREDNYSCSAYPDESEIYTYYPDGKRIKQYMEINSDYTTIRNYGEDGRRLRDLRILKNNSSLRVYQYK